MNHRKYLTQSHSSEFLLQCSAERIEADMKRAADERWVWGAKTVRGAYMHQERARAQGMGYASPIQDTLADTHSNYNR